MAASNHNGNGKSKGNGYAKGFRMYVRHHCAVCKSRVFPYDKYESLTESPRLGKNSRPVLLASDNGRDPEDRLAWCWSCNQWRPAIRMREKDFLLMYLKRKGVIVRKPEEPLWKSKTTVRKR